MQYLSLKFYIFLLLLLAAYYAMPKNRRYAVLLLGSIVFYVSISGSGIFFLALAAAAGFFGGLLIDRAASRVRRRAYLFFSSVSVSLPSADYKGIWIFQPFRHHRSSRHIFLHPTDNLLFGRRLSCQNKK